MLFRMFAATATTLVLSLNSGVSVAEEGHELSSIRGEQGIDLKAYDHAMAGSIKDFVVWGSVNEATGKSELIMRRDGQDVKATFERKDNVFGGTIRHQTEAGEKVTTIAFTGLDRQKNEFSFKVNQDVVKVSIQAEEFRGNHFIKPTYTITPASGAPVSYKFEGQACYNYSLHMSSLMIAALLH